MNLKTNIKAIVHHKIETNLRNNLWDDMQKIVWQNLLDNISFKSFNSVEDNVFLIVNMVYNDFKSNLFSGVWIGLENQSISNSVKSSLLKTLNKH